MARCCSTASRLLDVRVENADLDGPEMAEQFGELGVGLACGLGHHLQQHPFHVNLDLRRRVEPVFHGARADIAGVVFKRVLRLSSTDKATQKKGGKKAKTDRFHGLACKVIWRSRWDRKGCLAPVQAPGA